MKEKKKKKVFKMLCCSCMQIVKNTEGRQYEDLFICNSCDTKARCANLVEDREGIHGYYQMCVELRKCVECDGKMRNCECEKFYEYALE